MRATLPSAAWGLIGVLVGAAVVGSGWTQRVSRDVVGAHEFRLVDDEGKSWAVLTLAKQEPSLAIYDARGRQRIGLGLKEGEPRLTFLGEQGEFRVLLAQGEKSLPEHGRPALIL